MSSKRYAVLGFRCHTGWAAVVALLRRDGLPDVLERRRIACEPKSGRFLYHAAAELAFESREKSIATGRREARAAAVRELKSLVESLKGKSVFVAAAAVPGGNTKLPDKLADILAAHSRIHAAEGAFYRETVADACADIGLDVLRPPERELWSMASRQSKLAAEELAERMRAIGKELGPPWGEDQKLATLAAWLCTMPRMGREETP